MTDIEQAEENARLRADIVTNQIMLTALVMRDGRIRITEAEMAAADKARSRVTARKDPNGALMLELLSTAPSPPVQRVTTLPLSPRQH